MRLTTTYAISTRSTTSTSSISTYRSQITTMEEIIPTANVTCVKLLNGLTKHLVMEAFLPKGTPRSQVGNTCLALGNLTFLTFFF